MKGKETPWLIVWVTMALAGIAIILYQTRSGPGLASDSVVYLQGAQNLQLGRGFSRTTGDGGASPIADFPPLFSTLLALLSFGNTDLDHLIQVGRWMNAVLFGANILLASWLVRRYTASWGATIVTSSLLLVSRRLIQIHSWVMTEGTFICLLLLAILFLDRFFTHRRCRDLLLAGLAMGLLTLVRYAGLAFLLSAILALWFFQGEDWRKRLFSMSILGLLGLIPLAVWSVRNVLISGEVVANRQIGWYSLKPETISAYLREGLAWVLPSDFGVPWRLRVLMAISIIGLFLLPFLIQERWFLKEAFHSRRRSAMALPGLLLPAIPIYLLMLIANSLTLDASTSPAAVVRYLLPGWVCFVILTVCAAYKVLTKHSSILPRALVVIYLVVWFRFHIAEVLTYTLQADYGLTAMVQFWREEQEGLRQLDLSRPLISTDPERTYLLSGRPSYRAPRPQTAYTQEINTKYSEQLLQMRRLLQDGAYLVIVEPIQEEDAYLTEITQGLDEVMSTFHVRVYAWPNDNEP